MEKAGEEKMDLKLRSRKRRYLEITGSMAETLCWSA